MTEKLQVLLSQLGFKFGINGPHAARTMMLDDLRALLSHTPADANRKDYATAVVDENVLGKATKKSRELALRHLTALYSLEAENPIFRALRRLWPLNEAAQPLLALAVSLARDPLLKGTQKFFLTQPLGNPISRESVEAFLGSTYPDRFSAASLKSFAQNVSGTWTSAGILVGRVRKFRSAPQPSPEALTMLLFLSYLEGRTGQRLFSSNWMNLLDQSTDPEALADSASHRGLLVFMNAGGVKEVRFPGYLTPEEEQIRQELSHVV